MQYVGSKRKIVKELKQIIESYLIGKEYYIEPFVGGANMICKIDFNKKIGYDLHKELISLLCYVRDGGKLPKTFTEEQYNKVKNNKHKYPDWLVGLYGFCGTFGNKYFGGFCGFNGLKPNGDTRNKQEEAIRNLEKQRKELKGIDFINGNYKDLKIQNAVIYCDPPYKGTIKYKVDDFDYDKFYKWCIEMTKLNNIVLVSEYNIEHKNFKEIWSKEVSMQFNNNSSKRVEKLYIVEV